MTDCLYKLRAELFRHFIGNILGFQVTSFLELNLHQLPCLKADINLFYHGSLTVA